MGFIVRTRPGLPAIAPARAACVRVWMKNAGRHVALSRIHSTVVATSGCLRLASPSTSGSGGILMARNQPRSAGCASALRGWPHQFWSITSVKPPNASRWPTAGRRLCGPTASLRCRCSSHASQTRPPGQPPTGKASALVWSRFP